MTEYRIRRLQRNKTSVNFLLFRSLRASTVSIKLEYLLLFKCELKQIFVIFARQQEHLKILAWDLVVLLMPLAE